MDTKDPNSRDFRVLKVRRGTMGFCAGFPALCQVVMLESATGIPLARAGHMTHLMARDPAYTRQSGLSRKATVLWFLLR